MQTFRIQLPTYHQSQAEIARSLTRFNVLDCGRRWGKDVISRNWIVEGMLAGSPCAWFEPTYKEANRNWRWFVDKLKPVTKGKNEVYKQLELITGGSLTMWSIDTDGDAGRGNHYKQVVINEAAMIPNLEYAWTKVIDITLADLQGSAIFASTPRGFNYFKVLYDQGQDKHQRDWSSWRRSTWDNPYIARTELERFHTNLPELAYRQEIMADWIADSGMVFRRVMDAARLEPLDSPIPGHQYIAGVDVAASVDFTVCYIFDAASKEMVYQDRFNRVDYGVLEDRLDGICRRWNLDLMIVESNSIGQPVLDALSARGLPVQGFTTTQATKQAAIQALQSAFEHDQIAILNDPVLIGELLAFESKRSHTGGFSYSAPSGQHDDCVMALAIAWHALTNARPLILFGA
jgi:hypothetical protein